MDENCREVLTDLEIYLDGECPGDVAATVARHLADCRPCLDRADFERELRAILARHCCQAAPAGLLDRVMERLQAGSGSSH